jgi:hypothetical protein
LQTAIQLWFQDGEPVSIHTLAYAAYEIVHVVSKQRNPGRRDLLFDSLAIADEYRREVIGKIKEPANFFKHAKTDENKILEYSPDASWAFIMYAILGVQLCGERLNVEESAFLQWVSLQHPELLTEEGRRQVVNRLPPEEFQMVLSIPKKDFLQMYEAAQRLK